MKSFIKLGIGAVLLGVGFVVSMQAQRELIDHWKGCDDCEDESVVDIVKRETAPLDEDISSFVDADAEETE